jgi:sulfur carrier protein ThiS adenylyltransferase
MRFSEIKTHLSKFRVGIAGAGGLGSNCAVALARSGVGTLVIADFDVIEEPNLNRQYYFTDQIGLMKTVALKDNIANITMMSML